MGFYDHLRDLRKLKGFTIRELADRSGVSAAYISQLENGNRGVPSPEVLMKLSEGLNTSYSELMQAAGYLDQPPPAQSVSKTPINLRRFLRENDLMFDGVLLSDVDKEWLERVLTALFWKEKLKRDESPETDS